MPERWIGITVASEKITVVDAEVSTSGPLVIQADHSWALQNGDRTAAYDVMYRQVTDYVRDNRVARVAIKGSAISLGGTKLAHLESAELRGVVAAAAASIAPTQFLTKAHISRTFGERKVDEYLADQDFWSREAVGADIRRGSREAAMVLLAMRGAR